MTRTRDRDDERRVLINLTSRGVASRATLWGITGKIKTACQLDESGLTALWDTLDAFARPARERGRFKYSTKGKLMKIGIIGAGNIGAEICRWGA